MIKPSGRQSVWLRWGLALLTLALVLWLVEPADVGERLKAVQWPWLLLALAITPVQVLLSAWRWRFTVGRLGGRLPLGYAVREYYVTTLVNQLVPGGVVGDAGRALRYRQRMPSTALAIHGVMIERLSGQLLLVLVGLLLVVVWLPLPMPTRPALVLVPGALVAILLIWSLAQSPVVARWWSGFSQHVRTALFSHAAWPVQFISSLLVISSYLAVFWCLAMGLGLPVAVDDVGLLLALCTILLMSMTIPLTVAGWGVREGTAAMLWPLAGMDAESGMALAVCYGLLVLVSALPGALFLVNGERRAPDQTAYHCPD